MQYNAFAILVCNSIKKEGKTLPLRESNVRIRGSFHIYGGCFFLFSYIFLLRNYGLKCTRGMNPKAMKRKQWPILLLSPTHITILLNEDSNTNGPLEAQCMCFYI